MKDFSNKFYSPQSVVYDEHRWFLVWATGLFGGCSRSVRRMFKELGGFAYRIQVAYHITEMDERSRLQYCNWVLSMTYTNPDFFSNIWFSDESYIHLNGYINRQTTRFLGFERPDVVVQKPLPSGGLRFGAPYPDTEYPLLRRGRCTESANNIPGTLQRDYYCPICAGFETFLLRQKPATGMTVDAARWSYSPHGAAVESLACLQQHLGDRLISRGTEFPFPSHSPDFTAPMPTYGSCWKNPFSDQVANLEMFQNYGRK